MAGNSIADAGKRPSVERGWFGIADAAHYMGVSYHTVMAATRSGRLRAVRSPNSRLEPSARGLKTCRAWCDQFMESYPSAAVDGAVIA